MEDDYSHVTLTHGDTAYHVHKPAGEPAQGARLVVLVHGIGWWSFCFDFVVNHLVQQGRTVLTYDLYGRGHSATPHAKYDEHLFVTQLHELLAHVAPEQKIDLLGLSMGGAISACYAATYPDKINKLILVAPAGAPVQMPAMARLIQMPVIGYPLFWMFGKGAMLSKLKRDRFKDDFAHPEKVPELINKYEKLIEWQITQKQGFIDAFHNTLTHFPLENLIPTFPKIPSTLPVLLLWGDKDAVIPYSNSAILLKAMPHAKLVTLNDVGHASVVEAPEQCNPPITQFLASQ